MYGAMREAGFHGAEFGRIANVMSSSGALDGSRSTEEAMDRMEQYIERMSEFIRRTGMSIEQTEPYVGMMGNMGSSFDSMADMVVSTQRMSLHSGVPGEQLMQDALQATGPWGTMGVPYGDAVHDTIMNIGMARDSYSMSGQQMAWQQAGGWESVATGYEARGSNFMADPGILRWMGAAGPEGMDQLLSGDKMPESVSSELNKMGREDRLMAEYYGSLQASMDPEQWGDAYMARLIGHMEEQKVFDPRAQAIQLTNMGIYGSRAEATAALDLYSDRTDPGTQYRDTFSLMTGIQQEEGINLSQIGMSGLGVSLAVAREHHTTAGLNLNRSVGGTWSEWMAQEGIVDDPDTARYLASVRTGEEMGATGDIAAYANNPGYLGGGILFSDEGRGATLGLQQISDVLNDPNLSDSQRAQMVEIFNRNLAGQGSPTSWERGLDARSLSAQVNEIGMDDSGRVYFDVTQEDTASSFGAAGRVGQSGIGGLEDRGWKGIAGGILDVVGSAAGAFGGLGNRVFGDTEERRYYADEGFDGRNIIVSGIDPSSLYGFAQDFEALATPDAAVPGWFGASGGNITTLDAMRARGDLDIMSLVGGEKLGGTNDEVAQATRALAFTQQQYDPEALRTTSEILNAGDQEWDDLRQRLQENPDAWNNASDGRASGNAADRYTAVDEFAQSLYSKSWDALDPAQQRAMNYYLGMHHQDWGMADIDVMSGAQQDLASVAGRATSHATAEAATLINPDEVDDVRRSLSRATGATDREIGGLAEYMYLENTIRSIESSGGQRTAEQRELLSSVQSRRNELAQDESMFSDIGGIDVARSRYGTMITGFGSDLVDGRASGELGVLAAYQGADLLQAQGQVLADFDTHFGLETGTAHRLLGKDGVQTSDIEELRRAGVGEDLIRRFESGTVNNGDLSRFSPNLRNAQTASGSMENGSGSGSSGSDGAALGATPETAIYTRDANMEQALGIFRAIAGRMGIQPDSAAPTEE
jgi:hypothetical protein